LLVVVDATGEVVGFAAAVVMLVGVASGFALWC
jgi:hypothetical protein